MYIIISHDVDHLYTIEHWKKDLILEKYVARACMEMIKGRISFKTCLHRLFAPFQYRFCRIPEIVEYDIQHNIPSSFFFGMGNTLGMSYSINQAIPWIQFVLEKGFDVGVHAADISSPTSIQREHDAFKEICPNKTFGTRVHYVRYSDDTFQSLATAGYLFDTTEFSKESFSLIQPYVITAPNGNRMWEFPLNLMDGYVLEKGTDKASERVSELLQQAVNDGAHFFTFLFHDIYFNEKTHPDWIAFYKWFVETCEKEGHQFISYHQAINILENGQ